MTKIGQSDKLIEYSKHCYNGPSRFTASAQFRYNSKKTPIDFTKQDGVVSDGSYSRNNPGGYVKYNP